MAGQRSASDALIGMTSLVSTAITLTTQLEGVVSGLDSNSNTGTKQESKPDANLDALSIAHDAASLIKAHATKISLLVINEPFTPTAITKILRELVAGPLPALASAAQLCDPKRYTQAVSRDLRWKSGRVFREFRELAQRIPANGKVLSGDKKDASLGGATQKGSIAATGLLWSACDDVVALARLGVAGYLIRQVEQFRDTLKDIMEELKEWAEEESDDEDDGADDVDDDGHHSGEDEDEAVHDHWDSGVGDTVSTQAMLDDLMNSQQHIPRDDPEKIRERLDVCLKRLRLTTLLYQAIVKRRLKTLPALPLPLSPQDEGSDTISRLDEIMSELKLLSERFGSLTLAFYDLERGEIDQQMDECSQGALFASGLLLKPWVQEKDEFTDWALKYQAEIKKG